MMYARPMGQNPATEDAINSLGSAQYTNTLHSCRECVVCMQIFTENEEVICLRCDPRHIFHSECLKRWLRINNTCPICRQSIA